MKNNVLKLAGMFAGLVMAASANAALIFQGSSTLSGTVTQSPAEARAAWEAELASFGIDDLSGASGAAPFTSNFGNTYSETGNGSIITADGTDIRGNRNGAGLIEFDVVFPTAVNAVGFDVIDNDGGGMSLTLTDALTGAITVFDFTSVSGSGRTEFFGVVFEPTTFISSLRVSGTDPGGITTWDNFTTGVGVNAQPPAPINAPGTVVLFGLALAVAGSLRARANKA